MATTFGSSKYTPATLNGSANGVPSKRCYSRVRHRPNGNGPKTSVLNPYCQSHDVKNLFVTDGSYFVSLPGTHGITMLMMALSWRTSEYLADLMATGDIPQGRRVRAHDVSHES